MKNTVLASNLAFLFEEHEDIALQIHKRQRVGADSNPMGEVSVSMAQLRHFRDTLIRADAAFISSKAKLLEEARCLHVEQLAVRDAIVTIDAMARGGDSVSAGDL